jgi:hypothetical protein
LTTIEAAMPELPDLNSPEFAPIKARFARAYLEHKADLGVPNASDEAVLARVDDITAILFASSVRAWRTDDQRWKELVCSDHERAARRRAGQASRRLQPVPCRANEGGMDDDESAQARRTIADNMIDKLVD